MFDLGFDTQISPVLALPIGPWELLIVGLIVLLLFGSRLPSVMRSLGQSVTEFKKGTRDGDDADSDTKNS